MRQNEPRVAGALTDAAVRDDRVCVAQTDFPTVDRLQLRARAERPVRRCGTGPGNAVGRRYVPRTQGALLRIGRGRGPGAVVFFAGAHVDERSSEVREHVVAVGAQCRVIALDHGVVRDRAFDALRREAPALRDPEVSSAVEQAHVVVAEEGEHPEGVCGPPIALVAVDDDGVVARDPLPTHQVGESTSVDVVPHDRVVEFGVPVDLHRARDVPGLVQEHILIGFDHDQTRCSEMLGQPLRADQTLRGGVVGEGVGRVVCDGHGTLLDARRLG